MMFLAQHQKIPHLDSALLTLHRNVNAQKTSVKQAFGLSRALPYPF